MNIWPMYVVGANGNSPTQETFRPHKESLSNFYPFVNKTNFQSQLIDYQYKNIAKQFLRGNKQDLIIISYFCLSVCKGQMPLLKIQNPKLRT